MGNFESHIKMTTLIDRAEAMLTAKWKSLRELNRKLRTKGDVFRDLRDAGKAEEMRVPLVNHGRPAGEEIFYRCKP